MMKYKFLFVFLLFSFLMPMVAAQATISQISNQYLDYEDSVVLDISDYAMDYDDDSTVVTFVNPQTGSGVTLFGDTGGTHSNSYFDISLSTGGILQIGSNSLDLSASSITVSVGNNYQTQDGTTFLLYISDLEGPSQIASIAGGTVGDNDIISYNLDDFFINYDRIVVNYEDYIVNQSVQLDRDLGQPSVLHIGGTKVKLIPTSSNMYVTFTGINITHSTNVTITAYNDQGSVAASPFPVHSIVDQGVSVINDTIGTGFRPMLDYNGTDFYSSRIAAGHNCVVSAFCYNLTIYDSDFNIDFQVPYNFDGNVIGASIYGSANNYFVVTDSSTFYTFDKDFNFVSQVNNSGAGRWAFYNGSNVIMSKFDVDNDIYVYSNSGVLLNTIVTNTTMWAATRTPDGNASDIFLFDFFTNDLTVQNYKDGTWYEIEGSQIFDTMDPAGIALDVNNDGFAWAVDDHSSGNSEIVYFQYFSGSQSTNNPPVQYASIANINMTYDENYYFNLYDFVLNYDWVTVSNTDSDFTLTAFSNAGSEDSYVHNNYVVSLYSATETYMPFQVDSGQVDVYDEFIFTFGNDDGTIEVTVPIEIYSGYAAPLDDGYVPTFVAILEDLFPDANSLTLFQRMSYMFVALFIVFFVIFLVGLMAGLNVSHIVLFAFISDLFLFLLLVSIGYVPIGVLAVVIILTLGFIYLRSKGGS